MRDTGNDRCGLESLTARVQTLALALAIRETLGELLNVSNLSFSVCTMGTTG